jgi:hypothetical protein
MEYNAATFRRDVPCRFGSRSVNRSCAAGSRWRLAEYQGAYNGLRYDRDRYSWEAEYNTNTYLREVGTMSIDDLDALWIVDAIFIRRNADDGA